MDGRDGEGSTEEYETLIQTTDVELLKRAWRQEKAAPEILKFEADLIARLTGQIELVEENVEQDAQAGIDPLTVSLYQMDLDRTQFLLRSIFKQSMISEENDMVAKPQLDTFVVCKTNYYLGHIQLEDNEDGPSDDRTNQRPLEEPFEMEPGVLYFVRYKAIKRFVEEGRINLF